MNEKSVSTLGRIASVLGVASKHTKTLTPIETILRMQHFQIWGFILMILAVAIIIWLVQKKLDSIDKQYKEQFILLHRLFKSHQDLQIKVHKNNNQQQTNNVQQTQPVVAHSPSAPNVFIPVPQPQVVVVETVKEESSSVNNDNDDDTSSVATVETLGTVESNVESNVELNESDNNDVNQKKIENDDSLPDMFN